MALRAAMIGLATRAVSLVRMRHGRRFVWVRKKRDHKQQPPQLFPGDLNQNLRACDDPNICQILPNMQR